MALLSANRHCGPGTVAAALLLAAAISGAAADTVTLYITDFGINQHRRGLATGDDFRRAVNRAFPQFTAAAQVLVVMPVLAGTDPEPPAALVDSIAAALERRIRAGLGQGVSNFEVQLIERVDSWHYLLGDRSRALVRFGRASYQAAGRVVSRLRAQGTDVRCHAVVGSNGALLLAQGAADWRSYLSEAWVFDGRLTPCQAESVIAAAGPESVWVFNTSGDWPSPLLPGRRLVSAPAVARQLKQAFAGIHLYLLRPASWPLHLSGMTRPHATFVLSEYDGRSYRPARLVTGMQLRPGALP